jgi:hypothetical protein
MSRRKDKEEQHTINMEMASVSFPSYENAYVRGEIEKRQWFAFNMDDTFYDCHKAHNDCARDLLFKIGNKCGVITADIEEAHKSLKDSNLDPWWDFVLDEATDEERKAKLNMIIRDLKVKPITGILESSYRTHKQAFLRYVNIKPAASSLIRHLKSIGKNILVICEVKGTWQSGVVRDLSILGNVDHLGYSIDCALGVNPISEVDGVFQRVLEKLNLEGTDLAYLGRHVISAEQRGIFAMHYCEGVPSSLNPQCRTISNLSHLERILRCAPDGSGLRQTRKSVKKKRLHAML